MEPVVVHAALRQGPRLQEDRRGELGPGGPDRARQRAGDRRARLAHRRAGGKARDPDVFFPHHRLFRRVARGAGRPAGLARTGQADAEELDWPLRGRARRLRVRARGRGPRALGVHHARRHADGGDLLRGRRGAPDRRLGGKARPGDRRLRRRMQAGCGDGSRSRANREKGHGHGPVRHASALGGKTPRVGRQLRAHGLWRRRSHGGAGA